MPSPTHGRACRLVLSALTTASVIALKASAADRAKSTCPRGVVLTPDNGSRRAERRARWHARKAVAGDVDEAWEYRGRLSDAQALVAAGRDDEALAVYDEVSESLAGMEDAYLRYVGSFALRAKARRLGELGRFDEELATVSHLQIRYGEAEEADVRLNVAIALTRRAHSLLRRRRYLRALRTADDALALCGASDDPGLRAEAAVAYVYRGKALFKLLRFREATRNSEALFKFMGPNPDPEVLEAVRTVAPDKVLGLWRVFHWGET